MTDPFNNLSGDYDALRGALAQISDDTRRKIAAALEPALNARAQSMPQETYEDKKALAKCVNAELRRFGLALNNPKEEGIPCLLMGILAANLASDDSYWNIPMKTETAVTH